MTIDQTELSALKHSIAQRWRIPAWEKKFPWWHAPALVRILLYADGSVRFNGGGFQGIQHVYSVLTSHAYSYVHFQVDFAHRDGADPTATIAGAKKLTDLDILNKYDQIWFFGASSGLDLTAAEISLLEQFQAAPKFGGILVTGDHANLGRGIAGQIPRAGQMRRYPAPEASAPGWNTTLVEGSDANTTYNFEDQSDDVPQVIRYKRYAVSAGIVLERRYRPHPVLCGPNGPIDVLPDHQHEGEALAPAPGAADPLWPSKLGHQEKPEVIAWGRIKDPAATNHGDEIGVISAYNGHNVDVGRILADSTWHHWFDINLVGLPGSTVYRGFGATASGQAALKKIDAYFLNCGVWLSPPGVQQAMRNAAFWSILWLDSVIELSPKASIWHFGEQAIDALGRIASRCTIHEWIFVDPLFKEKIPRWEWPMIAERFKFVNLPLEQYVAGAVLKGMATEIGPLNPKQSFPDKPPSMELLQRYVQTGVEAGVKAFSEDLRADVKLAQSLVDGGLRLNAVAKK